MPSRDIPRALNEVIDLVYTAAAEPTAWMPFLRGVGALTASDVVPFMVWDYARRDGQCVRVHPLDDRTIQEYATWAPHNPYVRQNPRLAPGQIRIIEAAEPQIRTSAFYNEWLRPRLGVGHNLAITLFSDADMSVQLSPLRDARKPPYGAREANILRTLSPHLLRALTIERKLAFVATEHGGGAEALDRAPTGMFLLDGRGRVVFLNRAAQAIVDQGDGLGLDAKGTLVAARSAEWSRLKTLIAGACATGAGRGIAAGGALRVSRPSERRAYQVLVSPLRHRPLLLSPISPCAIVFAAEPDRSPNGSEEALRELYGLTPAEGRVARLLAEGQRVSEIADTLSVREATVRTHVKRLLEKTGSRTQADLMRILCAIPVGTAPTDSSS
jgi:DNA-binding CsgD family transcriptional regulator